MTGFSSRDVRAPVGPGPTVVLALLAVQILFGLWPVAGAAALTELSPPALIGFRLCLGAPVLALLTGLPWRPRPSWTDLRELAVLAALGISINQLLFAEGLKRAGPIHAGILVTMIPAFTLIAGATLGRESVNAKRVAGIAVAMLGAMTLIGIDRLDLSASHVFGDLLLLGNCAAFATFLTLARPTLARVGTLPATAWLFVFGAVEALPFTFWASIHTDWLGLSSGVVWSLVFVFIGPTLLTYILNAYALTRAEPSFVAVFVYVQPVVSLLGAWILLATPPEPSAIVAAIVVLAGIFIATRPSRRAPAPPIDARPPEFLAHESRTVPRAPST